VAVRAPVLRVVCARAPRPAGRRGFVDASVHRWFDGLARELVKTGADESAARIQARLHLAVARGLLLDLLATGDRDGVNHAYKHYLELAQLTWARSG
jgi:hypothetical protein